MPPYNAYTSSISSSRLSSYSTPTRSYSGTENYTSISSPSTYHYKPPIYSSTLSSKYRSPSTYSTTNTLPRNYSSSYLATRVPKFNSVSSYTSAVLNSSDYKWKSSSASSSDSLYRSPSLSRRNSSSSLVGSSYIPDRNARASLPAFPVSTETTSPYKASSWSCDTNQSSDDKSGTRVGLNNLGNTCFMNAVLQCLCHTQPLVDYCVKGSYISDVNHRSPTRGDLVKAFAEFVKKLTDPKLNCSISPHELRREVQRYAPRFCGDHQQDAQEFLRYLLQGIHDDINRVKYKSTRKDECGSNDAQQIWRRYKEIDDSLIVDLFAGQLKSTLKCTTCNNDSITYDPFWDLSLPIPDGYRNSSLRSCFNLFSSPEYLDGNNKPYCEVCKKKSRSTKKIEVNKFPKVLVIHLKRFSATSYGQKLNMTIDCPLVLSNVSEFSSQTCTGDNCSYALYGVVDHDGSNNSGHYTAKCRNPLTKEWSDFNDSRVTRASNNVVTSKSYILFYIQEGRL
ncbi:hypothetical protein JTE90_012639 [Oedothorax gibbosus]|uniref:Ubiquitin carboxyl-terminal hydrolase n=1 Tax=Oedothorax gibbosus TaxID=931172 RepID=A0AAV6ULW5_9ARAC|nr:hypothetical protein JTE90_012639 [Oedothorax gibbosus]